MRLRYAAILLAAPGATPEEAATVRQVERPSVTGGVLRWQSDTLDVRGEWRREQPPIRETLLRDKRGAIRWHCRMPRAKAALQWRDRHFSGTGYVESLTMTIPPTTLPFHTLRWGRHLSSTRSLVWIDWAGDVAQQWIWRDGIREHGAAFIDDGIALDGRQLLQFRDSRNIRKRFVLPPLATSLASLAPRMIGALGTLHEQKMVARSTLGEATAPDDGWTVHEVVRC